MPALGYVLRYPRDDGFPSMLSRAATTRHIQVILKSAAPISHHHHHQLPRIRRSYLAAWAGLTELVPHLPMMRSNRASLMWVEPC